MSEETKTVEELKRRIADLKARLPRHSISPAMVAELDDLEEALEQAQSDAREVDQQ